MTTSINEHGTQRTDEHREDCRTLGPFLLIMLLPSILISAEGGRTRQVKVRADHRFRVQADDIRHLEVRDAKREMVPIGTFVKVDQVLGPQTILRCNLFPSAAITGQAAPGFSSGQALNLMEHLAEAKLPLSMGYEWTGVSYQEKKVGSQAIMVFVLAIVLVFLVLAAQYESWSAPAAVILVVPLAVLGTVIALLMRGFDNNVYTQIGIVLAIGLASKSAILIVEFAGEQRARGKGILDSAVTAVVDGMMAATVMSLVLTPVFYVVMQRLSEFRRKDRAEATTPLVPEEPMHQPGYFHEIFGSTSPEQLGLDTTA